MHADDFSFDITELEGFTSTNNFNVETNYLFRVLISIFRDFREASPKYFTFHFKMNFDNDKILSDLELDSIILERISNLNIFDNIDVVKIISCSYRPVMEDTRILN